MKKTAIFCIVFLLIVFFTGCGHKFSLFSPTAGAGQTLVTPNKDASNELETWGPSSTENCVFYQMQYDANGGIGEKTVVFNKEDQFPYQLPTAQSLSFSREGYTFQEWNTKPDGSGTTYLPGDEIDSFYTFQQNWHNTILYAIWEEALN